ncbi:MAG TPA: SRPBCC family protein [Casimicrobiaceae bacterium]|nr:SRPBCC family protein [Casimicrobiaceae bacterium]
MRAAAIPWLIAVASWAGPALAAAQPADQDISVQVRKDHTAYEIDFEFTVAATIEQTWNVLSDFDHMAQILSNVDSSRVVSRDGNRITVAQTSHGKIGLIHVSVDGLREIDLTPPTELRSHLIRGDLRASDFVTELHGEGTVTRVSGHGKIVVAPWVGLALGAERVAAQTRQQYQELRSEILRRKAL